MSNSDRAKQFLPFDALKGLTEALRIKEYEHERITKGDLSDDLIDKISTNMINYNTGDKVKIKYFIDGYYKYIEDIIELDFDERIVNYNDIKIPFDSVFDFEILDK